MNLREKPDPNIPWSEIRLSSHSDKVRPEAGYRICNKCERILPINRWYFSINRNSPDGYNYTCKECCREYQRKRKQQ